MVDRSIGWLFFLLLVAGCDKRPVPPKEAPGQLASTSRTGKPVLIRNAAYFTIRDPRPVFDRDGRMAAIRSGRQVFQLGPGLADDIGPLIRGKDRLGVYAVVREDTPRPADPRRTDRRRDSVLIVLSVIVDNKTFLVR